MSHHLDRLISEEASTLLTPSITAQLDAHRAELLEEAHTEARQEGQCLFHTQLQSLQSKALADAQVAFTQWKTDNNADFTAKREATHKESLWDLAVYKHALTVKAEEQKEHACLKSIKGVDRSKATFAHIGRQGHKTDPMGPRPSQSVSRSRAVSPPSPSPSSLIALDKTPTKADFALGMKVDKDPLLPVVQAMANPPIFTDAQPAVTTTCVGRMDPPLGVGDGTPPGPLQEDHTLANNSNVGTLSLILNASSHQVITPPSITPVIPAQAESDEEHLMRLIGSTISMALKPLQDDISCLAGDVSHLTKRVKFIKTADDGINLRNYPPDGHELSGDIPLTLDYDTGYVMDHTHKNIDDDAKIERLEKDIGGDHANKPHPYFYHLCTMEKGLRSGDSLSPEQETEVAILQDLWYKFCEASFSPHTGLPPLSHLDKPFWEYWNQLHAAQAITAKVAAKNLIHGAGKYPDPTPPPPAAWGAPHIASLGDIIDDPIVISSADNVTPPPSQSPWTVVGGKAGRSYAKVTAKPTTKPLPPTPSLCQAQSSSITLEQLQVMTKMQVVNAFNLRFTPRITAGRHSKDGVIAAYLDQASRPVTATSPTPSPKPIRKTEYTLIRDPRVASVAGLSGCHGDTADLVRTI